MKHTCITLILVSALCFFASGCAVFPSMINDRSKGTIFTVKLEPNSDDRSGLADRATGIIKSRLRAAGLDGEVFADKNSADQITVKLYAANDLEKIKKLLFTTNQLELKEVVSPSYPNPIEVYPTREAAAKRYQDVHEILPYTENGQEGFVVIKKAAIVTGDGIRDATVSRTDAYIVTGDGIRDAPVGSRTDAEDDYYVSFLLKPEDAQDFGDWTGKNIAKYLAIVLDKKVISAPYIKSQILDSGQIDGRFTKEEAENIALSLKSGYLPATMKIVKEETFGN